MSQIIGGHVFVPLERNIDDVKLNSITSGATITSELISTQTLSTSAVTNDQFLILKAAGTLARILYDDLANSLGSAQGMVNAITSVRLRSFNAVGNPNFEVDQKLCGTSVAMTPTQTYAGDRWQATMNTGMAARVTAQQIGSNVVLPGTNFLITQKILRFTLTTVQASLGANDYFVINQSVEGPLLRELLGDVHSVSCLARSSVANLKFGFMLLDTAATQTRALAKVCTLGAANTWTLITLAGLPIWSPGGTFPTTPGSVGYYFDFSLAAGASQLIPVDTWQNTALFGGAVGQSNWLASAVNSTFDLAFIQHEPGPQCTTLIDKPFTGANGNYEECLRYWSKSYPYSTAFGATSYLGCGTLWAPTATFANGPIMFPKRMARIAGVNIYSPVSGASNTIVNASTSAAVTVTAISQVSDSAVLQIGGAVTAGAQYYAHYTADTGW